MEEIWRLLPYHMAAKIKTVTTQQEAPLEEIRLRVGASIELIFLNQVIWVEEMVFTKKDSMYLINQLSEHSLYRMQQELKEGYITTTGGHRVGLAGEVSLHAGELKQIQNITFFNIRIAKQMKGIAKQLLPFLRKKHGYYTSLMIGAPQTGKTTILRDLARSISNGTTQYPPLKVGIVDERSEIAACYEGIPQHDIGKRSDVMDACLKADGLMMMIRSMSPDVLIADEIGTVSDVQALIEAMTAGVAVICSVHGDSIATVKKRPSLRPLFDWSMFERFIVLQRKNTTDFYIHIENREGVILYKGEIHLS